MTTNRQTQLLTFWSIARDYCKNLRRDFDSQYDHLNSHIIIPTKNYQKININKLYNNYSWYGQLSQRGIVRCL